MPLCELCRSANLHESKLACGSVSGVSQPGRVKPSSQDQEPTPFAHWLDAMIPAKFRNDAEFARAIGVEQVYVYRWRRGTKPQIPMLVRISKATGTSVETLAEIVGYQPSRSSGGRR